MFFGRFAHAIPILAIAGSLAAKKKAKPSAGTMPTDGPLFIGFLLAVAAIVTLLQIFARTCPRPNRRTFPYLSRIDILGLADEAEALSPSVKYSAESWRVDGRPSLPNPYADSDHPH
jgi:hypothetical protein